MTERWREKLGVLGRAEPDQARLRGLTSQGARMPEPGRSGGSRVLAAAVAFAVAAGALAFLVAAFRDEPADRAMSDLEPAAICAIPTYDPDVALLTGQPEREVALADLEGPGQPASMLEGPATDALRACLSSPAAVNFPADGWRRVETGTDEVRFASPHDPEGWWLAGFTEQLDGDWRQTEEEIVDQAQTPAQRGHDLRLTWSGDLVLDGGEWNDPLSLADGRGDVWIDEGNRHWGIPHVFDQATGQEVVAPLPVAGWGGEPYRLAAGEEVALPVALGGVLPALTTGTYDVVACVPELGLASPVGRLEVGATGVMPGARILTYPSQGVGMEALGGGTLAVVDGCLAANGPGGRHGDFIVWPDGHVLVDRDGRRILIDPVGEEVGALGDDVLLGGGNVPESGVARIVTGDIPKACAASERGYFLTSGLADAG